MAVRSTALKIASVALASLCVSTTTSAQQLFAGWKTGCYGIVCTPASGLILLPGSGNAPDWAGYGSPAAQNALAAVAIRKSGGQKEDEGGTDLDDGHFDKTAATSTGVAFAVVVSLMNGQGSGAGNGAPTTFAVPLTAHLDVGQTSDVVTNPEPTTQALMAGGLLFVGALAVRRRRRKSMA